MTRKNNARWIIWAPAIVIGAAIITATALRWRQSEIDYRLIVALRRNNADAALGALRDGADANTREWPDVTGHRWLDLLRSILNKPTGNPSRYPTALFVATGWHLRELPADGGNINRSYLPSDPPSQYVCVLDALLRHGANVNATNERGLTALQLSASAGESDTVRVLLDHGADINVHGPAKWMESPLIFAVYSEDAATVRTLLKYQPMVNEIRDEEGNTALDLARLQGASNIVRVFKEATSVR